MSIRTAKIIVVIGNIVMALAVLALIAVIFVESVAAGLTLFSLVALFGLTFLYMEAKSRLSEEE